MALRSKIYQLLKQYLDEYLYGFSKEQLEIAIIAGELELINVNFKPTKVNELFLKNQIPFYLKCGLISRLQVKFNYRTLLTAPIDVSIHELFLVFGPILIDSSDAFFAKLEALDVPDSGQFANLSVIYDDSAFESSPGSPLKSHNSSIIIQSLQGIEDSQPKSQSFITRYLMTLVKNLNIKVEQVHIRFEDEIYPYRHPYSITVMLDKFEAKCAENEWFLDDLTRKRTKTPQKGASVKEGKLTNLAVYLTSMSGMLIPNTLWEATLNSPIGIFDAFPASELRNLILSQAESLKQDYSCSLLRPFSIDFCFSTGPEKPFLKFTALSERISATITAPMAECLRNLKEYYQNAQLWWTVHKFRPKDKIITEPRREEETEFMEIARSEIVRAWFYYALTFIKQKIRTNLYDIPDGTQRMNWEEDSPEFSPRKDEQPENEENNGENSSPCKRLSLFEPRIHKVPGIAAQQLGEVIKEYNDTLSVADIENIKSSTTVLVNKPESYFPKLLQFSEIDFKTNGISIDLADHDINLKSSIQVEMLYAKSQTSDVEMLVFLNIDQVGVTVQNTEKGVKILEFGKIANQTPRDRVIESPTKALEILIKYCPSQKQELIGHMPEEFFIEILGRMSEIKLNYSHFALSETLMIYEAFITDLLHREILDADYMRSIEKKNSSLTWKEKFVKKQRQVIHTAIFKKIVLARRLIRRLLEWQGGLKRRLKRLDRLFQPVFFNFRIETGGVNIEFSNSDLEPTSNILLPNGIIELLKNVELTRMGLYGFVIQTREPLRYFYDYLLEISELTSKGLKRIKNRSKSVIYANM
jgi:hypothetical protein